tara:strand:- start:270 stop:1214 length:945 start_codon:yes stop_codon:yes gene_type:complete
MKKYLSYLFKLLLIPLFILLINKSVDYRNYNSKFVNNFIIDLFENDSLSIKSNYPERAVVKNRIKKGLLFKSVVLGSSRSMLIGQSVSNNISNLSVPGATIDDYFAVINELEINQYKFEKIYVEISPWFFNNNNISERYREFESNNTSLKSLLSIEYLYDNLKTNKYSINIEKNDFIYYKNGSIKYNKSYTINRGNKEHIENFFKAGAYGLNGFNNVEKINIDLLEKLVNKCNNLTSKIIFIMYPYPESIYPKIFTKYKNLKKTQNAVQLISNKYNVKILGSFNPDPININNDDFYDGMHLTEEGISKIMNSFN